MSELRIIPKYAVTPVREMEPEMTTIIERQIELHAVKAVRRIARDIDAARAQGADRSKQLSVGSLTLTEMVRAFDEVSASAVVSQRLHSTILEKLVAGGIVRRHGPALVLA